MRISSILLIVALASAAGSLVYLLLERIVPTKLGDPTWCPLVGYRINVTSEVAKIEHWEFVPPEAIYAGFYYVIEPKGAQIALVEYGRDMKKTGRVLYSKK